MELVGAAGEPAAAAVAAAARVGLRRTGKGGSGAFSVSERREVPAKGGSKGPLKIAAVGEAAERTGAGGCTTILYMWGFWRTIGGGGRGGTGGRGCRAPSDAVRREKESGKMEARARKAGVGAYVGDKCLEGFTRRACHEAPHVVAIVVVAAAAAAGGGFGFFALALLLRRHALRAGGRRVVGLGGEPNVVSLRSQNSNLKSM